MDEFENSFRWPKKGDRLLRDARDRMRGVDFVHNELSRHSVIWTGYMRAGEALIKNCGEYSPDQYFLIYPILYSYRHGVELAMKWVIDRYGPYTSVEIGEIGHHDLWQLWKLCKKVIFEISGEDDDNGTVKVVEQGDQGLS